MEKIVDWLRDNIPVTPEDKTQHQNLTEIIMWFTVPFALLASPILALWVLVGINLLAMAWEIPSLRAGNWKWIFFKESIADYVMTFKVTFIPFVIILIMHTRY